MTLKIVARQFGLTVAFAMLFGCSTSGSGLPKLDRSPGAMGRAEAKSWMSEGSVDHRLLYVSDDVERAVYVFTYPFEKHDHKPSGQLTGFQQPMGMCGDKAGDVWITDLLAHDVIEYAHGATTPTRTLAAPNGQEVGDCAVDPNSGDLAVTSVGVPDGQVGRVYVYRQARGKPHAFADQNITAFFECGYDQAGNLFVDGQNQSTFPDTNKYAELLSGSKALTDIAMGPNVGYPGGIEWHGTYWALEDADKQVIHHLKIGGGTATEVGSTVLKASSNIAEFVIYGDKVIGTDGDYRIVQTFDYPAGGDPIKEIGHDVLYSPVGIAISSPPTI